MIVLGLFTDYKSQTKTLNLLSRIDYTVIVICHYQKKSFQIAVSTLLMRIKVETCANYHCIIATQNQNCCSIAFWYQTLNASQEHHSPVEGGICDCGHFKRVALLIGIENLSH